MCGSPRYRVCECGPRRLQTARESSGRQGVRRAAGKLPDPGHARKGSLGRDRVTEASPLSGG